MAIEEGTTTVVDTPVAQSGSASTGSTGTQAPSQPAQKWEETPQYRGQVAELQKERKARQTYEANQTRLQAEVEEWKRKAAALTGISTPSKEEAEVQAIRDRFKEVFPHLADLTPEDIEAIRESKARGSQTDAFVEQHWTNHHSALVKEVHAGIAKELGELSPRQIKRINAAYVAEATDNPEFMQRISEGDKAAVAEFVKDYLEDFVGPIQRKQHATDTTRFRLVPGAKDRSVPAAGGKKIDPSNEADVKNMLGEVFRKGRS